MIMKMPFKGLSLILLTGLFFISGCVTTKTIKVSSSQTGTKVTVDGKYVGLTGPEGTTVVLTPEPNQKTPEYKVVFSADGYFDESIILNSQKLTKPINEIGMIDLTPITVTKSLKINSNLNNVEVFLGDKLIGHSGDTVELTFKRPSKNSDFSDLVLTYKKDEYQTEQLTVKASSYAAVGILPTVSLERLVHTKTVNVTVKAKVPKIGTFDQYVAKPGYGIQAYFDGKSIGAVPESGLISIDVPFSRKDKSQAWSKHTLTLDLIDEYVKQSITFDYDNVSENMPLEVIMEPVLEYQVTHYWPVMDQNVQGPVFKVEERTSRAMRFPSNTYEGSSIVSQSLAKVTSFDYTRGINRSGYLTSFTPTPEGLDVIYSVTKHNDDRDIYYSNLYRKSVDGSGGETPITSDKYYHYLNPVFGLDETRTMVFQSNENSIKKTDLYRAKFNEDYYPVGGFARITLDDQFYTKPTFVDSKDVVFYVSYQNSSFSIPAFGSIRLDSGQPTRYANVKGEEPVMSIDGYLYYVKLDTNSGKKQIFRSTTDGMSETRVLSDMAFRNSNCFSPSISPDGTMMVFVSDKSSTDEGGDNNIFLYNLNTQEVPLQLTRNESDDISPKWVPSRSTAYRKRIFFMSNREGAYNIWRLDIK